MMLVTTRGDIAIYLTNHHIQGKFQKKTIFLTFTSIFLLETLEIIEAWLVPEELSGFCEVLRLAQRLKGLATSPDKYTSGCLQQTKTTQPQQLQLQLHSYSYSYSYYYYY